MAVNGNESGHPMDRFLQAMRQFTAPSRTDGMSTSDRLTLPGVVQSLKKAGADAAASVGRRISGNGRHG